MISSTTVTTVTTETSMPIANFTKLLGLPDGIPTVTVFGSTVNIAIVKTTTVAVQTESPKPEDV